MIKSNKVGDLFNKKHEIEKEIENLQKSCKHSKKSLKPIRERVDSSSTLIRWVCDECSSIIGIPSNDELEKYLNGR